jgi:hypothetical protein
LRGPQALAGYERALAIALELLDEPPAGRAGDRVAALAVPYDNLGDFHASRRQRSLGRIPVPGS